MARKQRLHLPGGLYHVMLRGNAGQHVFNDTKDRQEFYRLLAEGTTRFGTRVHGFCLMTNHVHLVLQVGTIPLSRPMQNLGFRYTRWANRRAGRSGHLFQGRYKALLVDADSYLLELIRYVHLNPVRAGLVRRLERYRWSSHRAYLGEERLDWLTTEQVLGQFGGRLARARERYRRFVVEGMGEERREEFHKGAAEESRIIGDEAFVQSALGTFGPTRLPRRPPALEAIVAAVCRAFEVAPTDLATPSRTRRLARARAAIGYLARQSAAASLTEVATLVGRDLSTLSQGVARLEAQLRVQPHLHAQLERIAGEFDGEDGTRQRPGN